MPQFTIDLPEDVLPVLNRKAQAWNRSLERFLSDYILMCLENESVESLPADARRKALEDILEERDKGPFIKIDDLGAYREGIMARVRTRIEGASARDAIAFAKEHRRQ